MNSAIENRSQTRGEGRVDAVALIDDRLPVECEIGPRRPLDFNLVARAEMTLLLAKELHSRGDHRDAFAWAVRASRELFEAVGGDRETQEPLKHLFFALDDLDKGIQDKALTAETVCNRKIFPSAEWDARACIAAALDARIANGERRDAAAEAIRKKILITSDSNNGNKARIIRLLIDWRKQFRSGKPPAGLNTWGAAQEMIGRFRGLPDGQRNQILAAAEDRLFDMAKMYRARLNPA